MSTKVTKMNEHVVSESQSESGSPGRRAYSPPTLVLFGQVAALTQSASGCAMDDSPPCATPPGSMGPKLSDRRLKQNITRVDTHPLGFGLYLFDYKAEYQARCGTGRQFGVMADEVEALVPEAVVQHADGYLMVNYEALGISTRVH